MHAIISIHDVMPHSLNRVQELLAEMSHLEPSAVTLLVVPGLDWQDTQIETLKALQHTGYRLAGHGWHHRARTIRTPWHRLHAALVSRHAAEHLALDEDGISTLISNCYRWFADHDLSLPDLYVPPAWAMGPISKRRLREAPFRYYESTAGFHDSDTGHSITLPLVGFEADTPFRVVSLKFWNGINKMLATENRPLRVSIHPNDHNLLLKGSLQRCLGRVTTALPYHSIF